MCIQHYGPPYTMVGDIQVSMKRKHEEIEEEGENFTEQRQSILNISMCKLQTGSSKRRENCLRRSVLIFNTLKFIEHQLQEEGVKVSSQTPSSPLPDPQSSQLTLDLDPPPSPMPTNDSAAYNHTHGAQPGQSLLSSQDNTTKCNMELSDSSSSSLSSSSESDKACPLPSDKTAIEAATDMLASPAAPQYNISSFTSLFDLDSKTVGSAKSTTSTTTTSVSSSLSSTQTGALPSFPSAFCSNSTSSWAFPSMVSTSTGALSSSTSSTSKSNDLDLFGDIDLTLYDLDNMFASLSPSSKLAPLSADELMHSFPGTGGMTDPAPFSSGSNSSMCCKDDIIHDELDHIMQILVGM